MEMLVTAVADTNLVIMVWMWPECFPKAHVVEGYSAKEKYTEKQWDLAEK